MSDTQTHINVDVPLALQAMIEILPELIEEAVLILGLNGIELIETFMAYGFAMGRIDGLAASRAEQADPEPYTPPGYL